MKLIIEREATFENNSDMEVKVTQTKLSRAFLKHGFRDNEVSLQAGYDVIVILRKGALQAIFHDGFGKSDHDFLIAFYTNFLSRMHGFRDNEVLLPTGNDVIVISPLGGVSHKFC